MMGIEELLGKTLRNVVGKVGDDEIVFETTKGEKYKLYHVQDCCESVTVEDICGEMLDLVGSPIIQAEANSNNDDPPSPTGCCSYTWTFYRLATSKGHIVIRWYGESNGCYSEEVDFAKVED